jgi:hypothetical protein
MKVHASIGTPVSCVMRAIGSTSARTVRAAQLAPIGSFSRAI